MQRELHVAACLLYNVWRACSDIFVLAYVCVGCGVVDVRTGGQDLCAASKLSKCRLKAEKLKD